MVFFLSIATPAIAEEVNATDSTASGVTSEHMNTSARDCGSCHSSGTRADGAAVGGDTTEGTIPGDQTGISDVTQTRVIDNGILNIDAFGETASGYYCWLYKGGANAFEEEVLISCEGKKPVYLSQGTILRPYPAAMEPNVWYDADIGVDLDGDNSNDIIVTRSILVPQGRKYFLVIYTIQNVKGSDLADLRLYQGVDYDAGNGGELDEGGYSSLDYVWVHDLDDGLGTYVGFKGNRKSSYHSVGDQKDMWSDLEKGVMNNAGNHNGDAGVGMGWNFGTLTQTRPAVLTVTFAFADTSKELQDILCPPARTGSGGLPYQPPSDVPALAPGGLMVLAGMLGFLGIFGSREVKRE